MRARVAASGVRRGWGSVSGAGRVAARAGCAGGGAVLPVAACAVTGAGAGGVADAVFFLQQPPQSATAVAAAAKISPREFFVTEFPSFYRDSIFDRQSLYCGLTT